MFSWSALQAVDPSFIFGLCTLWARAQMIEFWIKFWVANLEQHVEMCIIMDARIFVYNTGFFVLAFFSQKKFPMFLKVILWLQRGVILESMSLCKLWQICLQCCLFIEINVLCTPRLAQSSFHSSRKETETNLAFFFKKLFQINHLVLDDKGCLSVPHFFFVYFIKGK